MSRQYSEAVVARRRVSLPRGARVDAESVLFRDGRVQHDRRLARRQARVVGGRPQPSSGRRRPALPGRRPGTSSLRSRGPVVERHAGVQSVVVVVVGVPGTARCTAPGRTAALGHQPAQIILTHTAHTHTHTHTHAHVQSCMLHGCTAAGSGMFTWGWRFAPPLPL